MRTDIVPLMGSSQRGRIELKFDQAYATQRLAAYRKNGPDPSTLALIDAIVSEDIEGMTLLDIGGGVGAVQHALLTAGVRSAIEIEASLAYQATCRAEAERRGHGERICHVFGDFGSVADTVASADIVTLDRSLCCWPDMPELVSRSAAKARRLYGLVYPRDVWWVRHGWRFASDLRQLIRRSPMRVFIHRSEEVEAIVESAGLTRHSYREVGAWQVVVYRRDVSGALGSAGSIPRDHGAAGGRMSLSSPSRCCS